MDEQKKVEKDTQLLSKLNNDLLKVDEPEDETSKRNTKEWHISRILLLADENDLELNISNTKLKRMSKPALQKLLGELGEKVVKQQMAQKVGASGTDDRAIGLATLRMLHDLMANATEHGLNTVLPEYGYRVDGFTKSLRDPVVSGCVDDCLAEIAMESDILQHFESPYTRLMIAWSGAMVSCVRNVKKPELVKNAKNMGTQSSHRKNSIQLGPLRRKETRQVNRTTRPNTQNEG